MQNNWIKLLLIAKFIYDNTKNASANCILYKFYYGYQSYVLFKNNVYFYSKFQLTD